MLGDRPAALFIEGRLNEPLGYINGQASFFLIALWVCVAVAEQRRRPLLAGAGAGLATALGCLLVLSQSRGVALAALASTVLVLALLPGRLRRAWALLVVVAGTAAATPVLVDVYTSRAGGVDTGVAHAAARATLLAAVCAGVVWSLATMAVARAGGREPGLRRAAAAGLAVLLAAGVVTAAANQGTVRRTADEQYTAFVKQRVEPQSATIGSSTTRLASGAGNRYEYWRIAWGAWRDHPVGGTGAGGYDKPYFAARTTGENVRQPHSIVLQALSELGLGGALLLALLVGAVAAGALRVARAARESAAARFVGVAATGAFAAWLVHTSVDWMHLLPGLTAMALAGAAALLVPAAEAPPGSAGAGASRRIGRRLVPALVVGSILVVASVSLARQGLTEHFRAEAQDALAANPAEALVQADRALRLDHEAIGAYYVKSAALARFGRGTAARAVLLEATRREPENFVTWTLLGDLSVRMSNLDEAREHYRRALRLNPRDESLQDLVVHPEGATARLGGG
jgi:O-antigen ligase